MGVAIISGGSTVSGTFYRIVTRVTLDFTTVGAGDNNPGTVFEATGVGVLGAGDKLLQLAGGGLVATVTQQKT